MRNYFPLFDCQIIRGQFPGDLARAAGGSDQNVCVDINYERMKTEPGATHAVSGAMWRGVIGRGNRRWRVIMRSHCMVIWSTDCGIGKFNYTFEKAKVHAMNDNTKSNFHACEFMRILWEHRQGNHISSSLISFTRLCLLIPIRRSLASDLPSGNVLRQIALFGINYFF